jgi:hypothetical protein
MDKEVECASWQHAADRAGRDTPFIAPHVVSANHRRGGGGVSQSQEGRQNYQPITGGEGAGAAPPTQIAVGSVPSTLNPKP